MLNNTLKKSEIKVRNGQNEMMQIDMRSNDTYYFTSVSCSPGWRAKPSIPCSFSCAVKATVSCAMPGNVL
ncbi:hypothetical protein GCM10008018_54490 [Paenibacillus marchantiophytorum]|uniref:Lantibiotic n=1 Tax=Paenibacillus marchantiophytorum TaxID=1619310 RepID=A0ABQ1F758_9BACL|nr:hypothetical protein GCM10008018_54490 [Paenibacillus marchantiophytorum]